MTRKRYLTSFSAIQKLFILTQTHSTEFVSISSRMTSPRRQSKLRALLLPFCLPKQCVSYKSKVFFTKSISTVNSSSKCKFKDNSRKIVLKKESNQPRFLIWAVVFWRTSPNKNSKVLPKATLKISLPSKKASWNSSLNRWQWITSTQKWRKH